MKYFVFALAAAALIGAQTPAISIQPKAPLSGGRIAVPVLGYLAGPGPLDLRVISGTATAAHLAAAVALPSGTTGFFLPPREHYLLLENRANEPLTVWSPATGEGRALQDSVPHPNIVEFSSRGDSAVLYAKNPERMQVITGLPAEPVVTTLHVRASADTLSFAISDDGAVVVALLSDGSATFSLRGAGWDALPAAYGARSPLFIPRTHDLVISDLAQQTLTVIRGVGDPSPSALLLAHDVQADRLAFTKEGDVLLAASLREGKLWRLDLKTKARELVSSSGIDTLLPLRDGRTFLLSSPNLSLLNVPADGENGSAFVPVTR